MSSSVWICFSLKTVKTTWVIWYLCKHQLTWCKWYGLSQNNSQSSRSNFALVNSDSTHQSLHCIACNNSTQQRMKLVTRTTHQSHGIIGSQLSNGKSTWLSLINPTSLRVSCKSVIMSKSMLKLSCANNIQW